MTFTPLEALLMAAAASLVVGVSAHIFTRNVYVSQAQCGERRKGVCDDLKSLKEDHETASDEHRKKSAILFRMVRSLVAHNKDMPSEVKDKILNETPGGE